jgi:hypothetical protein
MNYSVVFLFCNQFVLLGWLLLLVLPRWKYTMRIVTIAGVFLLSICYSFLIVYGLNNFDLNSFSTLQNVQHLFENERALLAGWIHYLAFDLYMGVQIVKQTQELKISHLYNLFLLPVTFLFGPIGFVLFFLIKTYKQNYVSD